MITPIDVNVLVGGSFFQNLLTGKFLMKRKLNNGKGKVGDLSKSNENGLTTPVQNFCP